MKTSLTIPYYHQRTYYTCGPAALKMVLAFFKKRVSEERLARQMHTSKQYGTTHHAMVRTAQRAGLYVYVNERATIEELQFLVAWGHPVIVDYVEPSANVEHYALVTGVTARQIKLQDPWNGKRFAVSRVQFLKRWHGHDKKETTHQWLMAISRHDFQLGKQYKPLP